MEKKEQQKNVLNAISAISEFITSNLKSELQKGGEAGDDAFKTALNAYNRYQKVERGGVDYIFDITNKEDLIAMIEGGLNAVEIHDMVNRGQRFFHFGCNYPNPDALGNHNVLEDIYNTADDITRHAFIYADVCKDYREWIHHFFSRVIAMDDEFQGAFTIHQVYSA